MNDLVKSQQLVIPKALTKPRKRIANPFGNLRNNTQRAYLSDTNLFCYWLIDQKPTLDQRDRVVRLPLEKMAEIIQTHMITPEVICVYLQDIGFQYKLTTTKRKLAALSWALKENNQEDVTKSHSVKKIIKHLSNLHTDYIAGILSPEQIVNEGFNAPEKDSEHFQRDPAKPFTSNHLRDFIKYLDSEQCSYNSDEVLRLKTIITLWFTGAFRRSEIARIRIEHIRFVEQGMIIHVPKTKTGDELDKYFPYASTPQLCATFHMKQWLDLLNREKGFVFESRESFTGKLIEKGKPITPAGLVKLLRESINRSGLDIDFKGHSPRRGIVTDAYNAGANAKTIADLGWKSNVWMQYVDESADKFKTSIAKHIL